MPQSRKRRRPPTGSSSARRRPRPPDGELLRSIPLVQAVDEAERRGDAAEALRLMLTHADGLPFWRPRRYTCVLQMAWLGELLPAWATSRWIVAQAAQHLGEAHDPVARHRFHRALDLAIELRGGPDRLPGRDVVDRQCRVLDHDWVFRELYLYDLGGLQHFVRRVASPDLLVGADRVADWAAAPMGGYRFVGSTPGTATWTDLADDARHVTANIGSAAMLTPGSCGVGRMVPIADGVMFEAPPLPVPEDVALAVAADPHGWVEALRAGPAGLTLAGARPRSGLLSDVPDTLLDAVPDDVVVDGVLDGVLDHAPSVDRLPAGGDPWSLLFAALVEPRHVQELVRRQASFDAAQRASLAALGAVLAEPAAAWCRLLAAAPADAA